MSIKGYPTNKSASKLVAFYPSVNPVGDGMAGLNVDDLTGYQWVLNGEIDTAGVNSFTDANNAQILVGDFISFGASGSTSANNKQFFKVVAVDGTTFYVGQNFPAIPSNADTFQVFRKQPNIKGYNVATQVLNAATNNIPSSANAPLVLFGGAALEQSVSKIQILNGVGNLQLCVSLDGSSWTVVAHSANLTGYFQPIDVAAPCGAFIGLRNSVASAITSGTVIINASS